jgi:outer membrane lipoprotein-sorting protein
LCRKVMIFIDCLLIYLMFIVAAGASLIDPDAAAFINGAAADILDTETTVEKFLGKALPWNW